MTGVEIVIAEVAAMRGVSVADLTSESRSKAAVRVRQEAIHLAGMLTNETLTSIAFALNRDVSTGCHALRAIERRIEHVVGYGDELEAMGAVIAAKLQAAGSSRRQDRLAALESRVEELSAQLSAVSEALAAALDRRIEAMSAEVATLSEGLGGLDQRVEAVLAMSRSLSGGGLTQPVRAVLDAHREFETHRFSAGERFAHAKLDRALKDLQTTIERKDAA